jgi:catechol 2,3-dioxygenase-like lactoylglutathione lyase family enzyme
MNPLKGASLVGFAATTDGARSREFYQGKLGLEVVSEDQTALVLEANGSMIRIQKLLRHTPQKFTVLGWNVRDIEATVTALEEAGVRCEHFGFPMQDARGIATLPGGTKVAWLKDPDGNVLSVAQP